jgi:uncharacterized protein (DUF2236 family)
VTAPQRQPRDLGLFGPDSVAWRLHADPVMIVAAIRALLVQALEPRAMAGVDQHSNYRDDPWRRLGRTVEFIVATTYGDTATAEAACATVRRIHDRVHGIEPVTGRAYSAHDPDLLLWVHAVEVHSAVIAYRSYAHRVSDDDADRYVAEMAVVAELLGLPPAMAPRNMGELREYLHRVDGLQLTPAAREGMRTILVPPMPLAMRPISVVPITAAIAILPRVARRLYRLPWFAPATPSVRVTVFGLSRLMNVLVREHPLLREARARAAA